jgi:hypothetical protein
MLMTKTPEFLALNYYSFEDLAYSSMDKNIPLLFDMDILHLRVRQFFSGKAGEGKIISVILYKKELLALEYNS